MSSGKWRPFCLGLNVLRWDRMNVMSHQINDDFTIYSTVCSCVHKHIKAQRYWSFVRGIHRWSVDSHHKGPITRKRSPCLDIIMRKFTAVRDTACSDQPTIENQRGTVGMLQYGSGHDDVIKWKHFPRYSSHCAGNSPVTGEFPSQRPVTQSFEVSFDLRLELMGWVNNREAGDLRRFRAHYDVIVMISDTTWSWVWPRQQPTPPCTRSGPGHLLPQSVIIRRQRRRRTRYPVEYC